MEIWGHIGGNMDEYVQFAMIFHWQFRYPDGIHNENLENVDVCSLSQTTVW